MLARDLFYSLLASLFCGVAPARGAPVEPGPLPLAVVERAAAAGIPLEAIGAIVIRRGTALPVIAHQASRGFQPASTMKVLTTAVALDTLGPDYRARTELIAGAPARGGTLRGDLALRGFGDPDFDVPAFERMLRRLRASGVRDIRGDLVLDRTFFTPARTDQGLPPFDEAPEFRYNVIPDALLLNTNLMHLEVAAKAGRVAIEASPALPGLRLRSAMTLVDEPCERWDDLWRTPTLHADARGTFTATLQGELPRDCAFGTDIAILDRDDFIERTFRTSWSNMGGRFHGRVHEGRADAGAGVVATHTSRALAELVRDVDKRSDNPTARTVWLTLGALATGPSEGTTAQRADRVVREWLHAQAVSDDGLVLENGSGLSRLERIAPVTLAGVVERALDGPWAPEFVSSLPIVGVDGGMRHRLADTPAAKRARFKTGTLRDTWAVAGFVDAADGARYVVVAMVNRDGALARDARGVLDALIAEVAKGVP